MLKGYGIFATERRLLQLLPSLALSDPPQLPTKIALYAGGGVQFCQHQSPRGNSIPTCGNTSREMPSKLARNAGFVIPEKVS
jgi:hypothetical protein